MIPPRRRDEPLLLQPLQRVDAESQVLRRLFRPHTLPPRVVCLVPENRSPEAERRALLAFRFRPGTLSEFSPECYYLISVWGRRASQSSKQPQATLPSPPHRVRRVLVGARGPESGHPGAGDLDLLGAA